MDAEDGVTTMSNHEMISTLKSELAALQFKRDRLMSEVGVPVLFRGSDVPHTNKKMHSFFFLF